MTEFRNRLPIGQQDFKTLRLDDAIYVDKTRFIEKIARTKNKYCFLARPRRFGKSLFLSTMKYFFQSERDLFKGLYIDTVDWDWRPYPVLYLDLNTGEYTDPDKFESAINSSFRRWEDEFNITVKDDPIAQRFENIIRSIHEKTDRQVVILVDEYDKPLVKNLNESSFEHYRKKLAALYSNFKSCASHIRLVFLTGVSRFSKLSVFSDLNNLNDITFDNEFADICGITEKEVFDYFTPGIELFAEKHEVSYDEACSMLKKNYDGYRFAKEGSDIYNPWSLLNCMQKLQIANYWNETGFPSLLAESLRKMNVNLEKYLTVYCKGDELKGFDLLNPQPIALMYQTGYLTIKDYNERLKRYRLGIPNDEVKDGFFYMLLPYYVNVKIGNANSVINDIITSLILGNPEEFMDALKIFFAGIPYPLKMEDENNFRNAFYLLISLIGLETDAEVMTSDGRIDLMIKTDAYIYIIELKYDGTALDALDQINRKQYALKFQNDSRRIIKIGVNFSSSTRRIEDWIIS